MIVLPGCVAYWPTSEPSGSTTIYDTINNNYGQLVDKVSTGYIGKYGNCIYFYSSTTPPKGYVGISNITEYSPETISVGCWFNNLNSYSTYTSQILIDKSDITYNQSGYRLWRSTYNASGFLGVNIIFDVNVNYLGTFYQRRVLYNRSISISGGFLADWHHCVGTYDGYIPRLYIDGIEVGNIQDNVPLSGQDTYLPISYTVQNSLKLGVKSDNNNIVTISGNVYHYYGYMQHIQIYNRALTNIEIIKTYDPAVIYGKSLLYAG